MAGKGGNQKQEWLDAMKKILMITIACAVLVLCVAILSSCSSGGDGEYGWAEGHGPSCQQAEGAEWAARR